MLELWEKVPKEIKEAFYGFILLLFASAGAAIKMWFQARTFKQMSTNLVEAIEEGGCEVTKAASKRRNTATKLEPKVKDFIKKTVAMKLPITEGIDETPGIEAPGTPGAADGVRDEGAAPGAGG